MHTDNTIGLSIVSSVTVWANFGLKWDFFFLLTILSYPQTGIFHFIRIYRCFIDWFSSLMMFTNCLYIWVIIGEFKYKFYYKFLKSKFLRKNQVFTFKFQVSRALNSQYFSTSFKLSSSIFSTEFSLTQTSWASFLHSKL